MDTQAYSKCSFFEMNKLKNGEGIQLLKGWTESEEVGNINYRANLLLKYCLENTRAGVFHIRIVTPKMRVNLRAEL